MQLETRYLQTCEEVQSRSDLEVLVPAWRDLWLSALDSSAFQSPEWLTAWYDRIAGGSVLVLAVYHEERLTGIVPFHEWHDDDGKKVLSLAGTGLSDYLDVLAAPGMERNVAEHFACWLDAHSGRWHRVDLQDIPEYSPIRCGSAVRQHVCPVLVLSPDTTTPTGGMVRKWQYALRRAKKDRNARIEQADYHTFDASFDAFCRLHLARLASSEATGLVEQPEIRQFLEQACAGLLETGILRLYTLTFDGTPVASLLALSDHGKTLYFLGGFDPTAHRYSPGTLLVGHAIAESRASGHTHFDFLRGNEAYKYRWGAADTHTYRLTGSPERVATAIMFE